jgi:hypothetical protein
MWSLSVSHIRRVIRLKLFEAGEAHPTSKLSVWILVEMQAAAAGRIAAALTARRFGSGEESSIVSRSHNNLPTGVWSGALLASKGQQHPAYSGIPL